jgi:hypothetical protein
MKKEVFLVMFGLILVASLASAKLNVDKNVSFIDGSYSGGDFVGGSVKVSFQNQLNKDFSAKFNGTSSGTKISLLDILKKMNYVSGKDYSCEPANCKKGFETVGSGSSNTEVFVTEEEKYYGFRLEGESVDVTSFKFNLTSDTGEDCNNQLVIDLFGDDSWNYYNNKRTNFDCGVEPLSGCFSEDEWGGDEAMVDTYYYCEKIENIPPAPGYDLRVKLRRVSGRDRQEIGLSIHDPSATGSDKNWECLPSARDLKGLPSDSYGQVSCFANFSRKDVFSGFVCVKLKDEGEYWIKSESSEPCGGSVPGNQLPTSNLPLTIDFGLSVTPMTYASIGTITFNSVLYSSLNGGANLIPAVKSYINETYRANCSSESGCIIPFSIWGNVDQTVNLSAVSIGYTISSGGGRITKSTNKFYELLPKDFTINSNSSVLDISKMEFVVPNKKSEYRAELFFDGERILNRTINVDAGFDFSIGPRVTLVGQNTLFTIYPGNNESISSAVWKFGDGSSSVSSGGSQAEHVYRNESEYSVEVSATTSAGAVSSKTFKVVVGDAKESANQTLTKYRSRITSLNNDLNALEPWIKDKIKEQVNVTSLDGKISTLQSQFNQYASSGASSSQYLSIINQLLEMDVPHSISLSSSGTLPGVVGYNYIDAAHIISISPGGNGTDPESVKNGIIKWMDKNYDSELGFKTYSVVSDNGQRDLLTVYEVKLTKKAGASTDSGYLIINYPKSSIIFGGGYGASSVASGQATYISIDGNGQPNDVKFFIL